ncbi:MAG: type II secretion system F family protein [Candidatus Aenigmatarchaeota archaeon]
MSLISSVTKIFSPIAEKYEKNFSLLKESLQKADIKMPFVSYLSLMFFLAILSFAYAFVFSIFVFQFFRRPLIVSIFYSAFVAILSSVFIFVFMYFYPIQKISSRKRNIEVNLPFVIIHMGALVESGLPPYQMFKLISTFEEYGEIAKEFKKIVRNIEQFGLDPLTAIKEVASRCPSDELQQLLMGFVTTVESGGNIKLYLKTVGEQTLFDYRKRREKYIRTLDMLSEIYTGIVISAPIFMVAMFAIMNMIQPTIGGWTITDLAWLGTYVLVPVLNIAFILFLYTMEVEM